MWGNRAEEYACIWISIRLPSARDLIWVFFFLDCLVILTRVIWFMWIRWQDKLKETDGGRQRFLLELEFVQLLANPTYIHRMCWPAFVIGSIMWFELAVGGMLQFWWYLIGSSDRKSCLVIFNFSFLAKKCFISDNWSLLLGATKVLNISCKEAWLQRWGV